MATSETRRPGALDEVRYGREKLADVRAIERRHGQQVEREEHEVELGARKKNSRRLAGPLPETLASTTPRASGRSWWRRRRCRRGRAEVGHGPGEGDFGVVVAPAEACGVDGHGRPRQPRSANMMSPLVPCAHGVPRHVPVSTGVRSPARSAATPWASSWSTTERITQNDQRRGSRRRGIESLVDPPVGHARLLGSKDRSKQARTRASGLRGIQPGPSSYAPAWRRGCSSRRARRACRRPWGLRWRSGRASCG